MNEQTDRLVRNIIQALNSHDVEGILSFYAPDYSGSDVAEANPQQGLEGMRRSLTAYLSAFPDLRLGEFETVGQDSRVAVRWVAHGTHRGTVMKIPPTGRRISVYGSSFLTLNGGRIQRSITVWDVAGMLRSIGLLPDLLND
jgi:steroid delta-isomerase-like uncharacterized protein